MSGARPRRGFTLMEVLLALSLSVVLLSLLTFSINVYMRASEAGRGEVERAQLARVLLRRMADDLRSTLWKNTGDAAAADETASDSESGAGAASGSGSGTGGGTGAASGSGTGSGASSGSATGTGAGDSSGDDASTSSPSTSTEVPPVMGLYGEQGYVQVDVSRLPRIEQYASAMAGAGAGDIVSDVKTVAYYCQNANSAAASSATGLSRREFDRAVTTYASTNGDISAWERELVPLAEEVTAIEFRYFDGTEWLTEWDSEAKQALPIVVEIAIAISDGTAAETTSDTGAAATSALDPSAEGQTIYRLMVFLPQSQTPQTSGASALETMVSSSISSAAASAAGGQSGASGGGASTPQGGGSSGRGGGTGDQGGGGGQGGGGRGGQGGDGPPDDDEDGGGP